MGSFTPTSWRLPFQTTLSSHVGVGHKRFGPYFVNGHSMSKDSEWEFIFSFFLFTLKVPLFESNTRVSVQLILSHTHGLQGTWGAAGGRSDSCLNEGLNEDKDHYG